MFCNRYFYLSVIDHAAMVVPLEKLEGDMELSGDIYSDEEGYEWSAVIRRYPNTGGFSEIVWQKHGMRSQYNAETAMEAAWRRIFEGA